MNATDNVPPENSAASSNRSLAETFETACRRYAEDAFQETAALCGEILSDHPDHAGALHLLGLIAFKLDKRESALAFLERALSLEPDNPDIVNNSATVLLMAGQVPEAERLYRHCLRLNPDHPDFLYNLANLYLGQNKYEDAISLYEQTLRHAPAHTGALLNFGTALQKTGRLDEALVRFEDAASDPSRAADALVNKGNVFMIRTEIDKGVAEFRRAAAIAPHDSNVLRHLGLALRQLGAIQESIETASRSTEIDPSNSEAHFDLAVSLLMAGSLERGWTEFEWRFYPGQVTPRPFPQPLWQGEPTDGTALLVWEEQGVGDELLFANVLPDFLAAHPRIVLECDPRLVPLFARSFPQAEVIPRLTPPHPRTGQPDIRWQTPIASLFRFFRASLDRFPRHAGYLRPDPDRVARWKHRLAGLGPGLKVGFAWRSKLQTQPRAAHFTSLDQWTPIFAVPNVHFVNLQYDDCRAELEAARARHGVPLHRFDDVDLLNDLDEAAALTQALDLVIAPPTSVSMMAGALGVPVLEFHLKHAHWEVLGTGGYPWFPHTRLFTRLWNEPWDGALRDIAGALADLAASAGSLAAADAGQDIQEQVETALKRHRQGAKKEAETLYRQILAREPAHVDAIHYLGVLASQEKRYRQAIELIRQSIRLRPDFPDFHNNLGQVLHEAGQLPEAAMALRQAIRLRPGFAEAHNNLGNVLRDAGDLAAAADEYRKACKIAPDYAVALNNLGVVVREQGKIPEAVRLCRRALELQPEYGDAYNNLGVALRYLGKLDEAMDCYDKAIALVTGESGNGAQDLSNAEHADSRWNKSLILLMQGNLETGWTEYEWRWRALMKSSKRPFSFPWWAGQPLDGKTLLIWGEQGLGDELLFAGVLPDVMAQAGHCLIECHPKLTPLFSRSFPEATVIPRNTPPSEEISRHRIDFQCPIGNLPRWFRPTLRHFPKGSGYIRPDPAKVAGWRERFAALGPGPKVGISWRSMNRSGARGQHFSDLEQWGPVLRQEDLVFINLQYDDCSRELNKAQRRHGCKIHRFEELDLLNDLDGAAALTAALDLVIAPPTSVAMMAGALDVPVWQLTSRNAVWEILGTDGMPWFPNMKLFYRDWNESWAIVLEQVAVELRRLTGETAR